MGGSGRNFESSDKTLRIAAAIGILSELWATMRIFRPIAHLPWEVPGKRSLMFARRMVQLIESHAGALSEELMHRLKHSGKCPDLLQKVPPQELKMRTHEIYGNLSDWILAKTESEIRERYVGLGARRAKQGVPFSQFLFALNATKDCLWTYLEREGLLEFPIELLGDLDLLHSIGRFFDRAAYSAALGYETATREETAHYPAPASVAARAKA